MTSEELIAILDQIGDLARCCPRVADGEYIPGLGEFLDNIQCIADDAVRHVQQKEATDK